MATETTLGDHAVCGVLDAPDAFEGKYPGEIRLPGGPLATEQVALMHRRRRPGSAARAATVTATGPRRRSTLVLSGRLEFKLDDEVVELRPLTAVRVAPHTARSVWNAGPEEAVLIIASTRIGDPKGDVEIVGIRGPASFADDEFRGLLGDAGLEDVELRWVSLAHRVPDADELWRETLGGSVRTAGLVMRQPPHVRSRIRAAVERLAEEYRADGALAIPACAKITRGTRP